MLVLLLMHVLDLRLPNVLIWLRLRRLILLEHVEVLLLRQGLALKHLRWCWTGPLARLFIKRRGRTVHCCRCVCPLTQLSAGLCLRLISTSCGRSRSGHISLARSPTWATGAGCLGFGRSRLPWFRRWQGLTRCRCPCNLISLTRTSTFPLQRSPVRS